MNTKTFITLALMAAAVATASARGLERRETEGVRCSTLGLSVDLEDLTDNVVLRCSYEHLLVRRRRAG